MAEVEKLSQAEFDKVMSTPVSVEKSLSELWAAQKQEPHVWIEIQSTEGDPDHNTFVGYNGVSYIIKKGTKVPVPEGVVNILSYAELVEEYLDPQGNKQIRKWKRFPYSVLGPAHPEDVKSWKAANGSITK